MKDILFVITVIAVSAAVWVGSVAYDSRLESADQVLLKECTLIRASLSDAERRISKIERLLDGKYEERAASPVITVTPVVTKEALKLSNSYVTPVSATSDEVLPDYAPDVDSVERVEIVLDRGGKPAMVKTDRTPSDAKPVIYVDPPKKTFDEVRREMGVDE